MQDDYGLPGEESAEDLAAQLAAERSARERAERDLAALQRKHGAATPANGAKPPAAPGEVDLDALLGKISDRSRPWPELRAELEAAGFRNGYQL
jgi:hypothetical protein